jgi:hypothetical protein
VTGLAVVVYEIRQLLSRVVLARQGNKSSLLQLFHSSVPLKGQVKYEFRPNLDVALKKRVLQLFHSSVPLKRQVKYELRRES